MLAAKRALNLFAVAAAAVFAAFVLWKGIPTLRHDWTWPIDRAAVGSFIAESTGGWLSSGFGTPNPHPTTYLIALPLGLVMWLFGPLVALACLAAVIGYLCMRCVADAAGQLNNAATAALGIGLFSLFNPWVYNEVVAGHLVMVLAYGGLIGLFAEMLRGERASPVRLSLWICLIEAQIQFFVLGMVALVSFAFVTRRWLPPLAGIIVFLPSIVGLIAERATLLHIPYVVTWQANQSLAPLPLLGLSGYFPGYADRLGIAAPIAVWVVLGLALAGAIAARRSAAAVWGIAAVVFLYAVVLGVHGPFGVAYPWLVKNVPESGVFRELYDLVGILAALIALLACAATGRIRGLGYAALAAGIALMAAWIFRPPSDLWIAAHSYPHPIVAAPPYSRIALMPAFQPLGLRNDGGDGADPDAHVYPGSVSALNEYLPSYPVNMALARYEEFGDVEALRALGVAEIVARPWMTSRTQGRIGLAASSLEPRWPRQPPASIRYISGATPLISQCDATGIVALGDRIGACDVFFGDAPGYPAVEAVIPPSDSIDPRSAWIDARLAFAEAPSLAQAVGGALTQSRVPQSVEPGSWLMAYVRGLLVGSDGRVLEKSQGAFAWLHLPATVTSVRCAGLCELVAQAQALPSVPSHLPAAHQRALEFGRFGSAFYVVRLQADSAKVLRLNERYDPAWIAFAGGRLLPHVRIDMSVNGWFVGDTSGRVVLVQVTAVVQLIAEVFGVLCVLWLLKALAYAPTKRVREQ